MDPTSEIFGGTPSALSEEDLLEMEMADNRGQQQVEASMQQAQEEQGGQSGATASPAQPQQQTQQEQPKPEEPKSDLVNPDGSPNLEAMRRVGNEFDTATLTGLQDFGVDMINFFTGGKAGLKKTPKFTNKVAQQSREIQSIMIPTLLSTGAAGAVARAGKASKIKVLADPAVNLLGKVSLTSGSGALVDAISSTSEDHNLTGSLKKNFPNTWGWIPDDIATLDSDSPDIKRKKNVMEGLGLGLFVDLFAEIGPFLRSRGEARQGARWLPDAEKRGVQFTKSKDFFSEDDLIKDIELGVGRRSEALDELGEFNISKGMGQDPTDPMLGVHDMYGYAETGIRSVDDMGVLSARVDNARIFGNIDSVNGRIANFVSEPVIKFANEGGAEYSQLVQSLSEQITAAGRYGYQTSSGKIVSSEMMAKASDDLQKSLGLLTKGELQKYIAKIPKRELKGEIRKAFDDLINFEQMEANSLIRTSMAGQVADLAEGIRLTSGSGSLDRGLDQILDRMELLMVANADTDVSKNFLQRLKGTILNEEGVADMAKRKALALEEAKRSAKTTVDSLRQVKQEAPELLEPLMFAFEATGGNVKSIDGLNNYFNASTGTLSKAIVDGSPEVPSVFVKGMWATIYNNFLSAFGTPIKAAVSNVALLVVRPVNTLAGAIGTGDKHTIQRGMYQLSNTWESMTNAFQYMGQTFTRSGVDPDYIGVAGRETNIFRDEQQWQVLQSFADAKKVKGEYGPQALLDQAEALWDIAQHPWLRFGNRAMQAFDGFTQAFIGSVEARGRAFDQLALGKIDADTIDAASRKYYDDMFKPDELGRRVISDDAVRIASGEISLNLANPMTEGTSALLERVPGMKPFLLFSKTPLNALNYASTYTPFGRFFSEFNDFSRPFAEVPEAKMVEMLQSRGIPYDENAMTAYNAVRAELKGRKAMGTITTMAAVGFFMQDRLSGDGIADRQKMALRREAGWQKRSIKIGDRWVSYDGIPGISDLIALTANIMDNADTLGSGDVEELLQATTFILGASITEKTSLSSIEPMFDILSGNPNAITRWSASFLPSALIPGSSQLNELSKLFSPNLKVVDDNLASMIANRTPLRAGLPDTYDWIDGGKVREPENFIARIFNVYSPFKVSGKQSPEKQFLIDIEYDNRPSMATDGQGVKLSPQEQSAVYNKIGENGYFRQRLRAIMNTKDGKAFRQAYNEAQARGATINLKDFQNLHIEIDHALNLAKESAIAEVDAELGGSISQRRFRQDTARYHSRMGNVEAILAIPK